MLPTPATHASTHQATGSDPITMQTGNYGDATVTNPKIAPGAVGTSNLQNNATTFAKINKNAKSLSFTNVIVSDQAWEEGGNDPKYPYRAAISLPNNGITGDYFVDIVFDDTEGLANYADSFVDGFYIFAKDYPENLVVIRTADLTPTLPTAFTNDIFASIIVTYPVGRNVSCTDNTTTLNAKSTSGKWTFGVPNAGVWTISDGENEQTVSITTQGQNVSVELLQSLVLYDYGVFNPEIGVWTNVGYTYGGHNTVPATINSDNIYFSDGSSFRFMGTPVAVDVTKYTKLLATLQCIAQSNPTHPWVALSKSKALVSDELIGRVSTGNTSLGTIEIDISELSGAYYVVAAVSSSDASGYVYKVELK